MGINVFAMKNNYFHYKFRMFLSINCISAENNVSDRQLDEYELIIARFFYAE